MLQKEGRLASYANSVYEMTDDQQVRSSMEILRQTTAELSQILQASLNQRYAITILPGHNYLYMLMIKDKDPEKEPVYPLRIEIYRDDIHHGSPTMRLDIKECSRNVSSDERDRTAAWLEFGPLQVPKIYEIIQNQILAHLDPSDRAVFDAYRDKLFFGTQPGRRPN